MRNGDEKYQRHVRDTAGDYTIKKSRALDNVAKVVTLILAFFLWVYVLATNDVTVEQTFDVIPVDVQGTAGMVEKGLAVQSMSYYNLNVTLKGTRNALSRVTNDNLSAYVDLSEIEEPGEYEMSVKYNMPSGVALVNQSEKVTVVVDSQASKVFAVDHTNIETKSFAIADSCSIDYQNAKVNVDHVLVEAPTAVLSRIDRLCVTTDVTVTLSSSSDVSAVITLLDKNGQVITDESVTVKAYVGGMVTESGAFTGGILRSEITVNLPLIKQKEVPVSVIDREGILVGDTIVASPASVIIKGSPEAVDAMTQFAMGSFSAKNLVSADGGFSSVTCTPDALPAGITEVLKPDGTAFENGEIKASVTVNVGGTYELVVPASAITVVGGDAELVGEGVTVSLRTAGDETFFLLLESRVNAGLGGISLVVNLTDIALSGETEAPVTVIFSSDFEGKVYEIFEEGKPYTATVKPIA